MHLCRRTHLKIDSLQFPVIPPFHKWRRGGFYCGVDVAVVPAISSGEDWVDSGAGVGVGDGLDDGSWVGVGVGVGEDSGEGAGAEEGDGDGVGETEGDGSGEGVGEESTVSAHVPGPTLRESFSTVTHFG